MKKRLFLYIVMSLLLFVPELYGADPRFNLSLSEQFCRTLPPAIVRSVYMGDRDGKSDIFGGDNGHLDIMATLSLRKQVAPTNFTKPTQNPLFKERCESLAYQTVNIGRPIDCDQNWFHRFWRKTEYLSLPRIPTMIGHDQFVWTVKESKSKASSLGIVIICEYPIVDYVNPTFVSGSWMIGPQVSFSWKKQRR